MVHFRYGLRYGYHFGEFTGTGEVDFKTLWSWFSLRDVFCGHTGQAAVDLRITSLSIVVKGGNLYNHGTSKG